jgi:DNA end-binding protein Ku
MPKPRSLMNATLVFGGVALPVRLHTATSSKDVHFTEVHAKDGAKIEHRRFCSKEDKEVPYEEVAKGYEVSEGKYAVLTKEQLSAAVPHGDKSITVEAFVPEQDIDLVFFDRGYYLGCGEDGGAAYRVLHDALAKTGRAGIARFVFHDRERLAALRPHDGVLILQTLRFADELADPDDLRPDEAGRAPTKKEADMAGQLIESLHTEFDPAGYQDEHRAAVMKLIEAKAAGEEIDIPEPEKAEASDDLAAALQASLDAQQKEHGARRRRATAKTPSPRAKKKTTSTRKRG